MAPGSAGSASSTELLWGPRNFKLSFPGPSGGFSALQKPWQMSAQVWIPQGFPSPAQLNCRTTFTVVCCVTQGVGLPRPATTDFLINPKKLGLGLVVLAQKVLLALLALGAAARVTRSCANGAEQDERNIWELGGGKRSLVPWGRAGQSPALGLLLQRLWSLCGCVCCVTGSARAWRGLSFHVQR